MPCLKAHPSPDALFLFSSVQSSCTADSNSVIHSQTALTSGRSTQKVLKPRLGDSGILISPVSSHCIRDATLEKIPNTPIEPPGRGASTERTSGIPHDQFAGNKLHQKPLDVIRLFKSEYIINASDRATHHRRRVCFAVRDRDGACSAKAMCNASAISDGF